MRLVHKPRLPNGLEHCPSEEAAAGDRRLEFRFLCISSPAFLPCVLLKGYIPHCPLSYLTCGCTLNYLLYPFEPLSELEICDGFLCVCKTPFTPKERRIPNFPYVYKYSDLVLLTPIGGFTVRCTFLFRTNHIALASLSPV